MKTKKMGIPEPPDTGRHPAATSLPLISIIRALRTVKEANLITLTGKGRELTRRGLADILDQELGYSEMYKALEDLGIVVARLPFLRNRYPSLWQVWVKGSVALAKARGVDLNHNDPTAPETTRNNALHSTKKEGV